MKILLYYILLLIFIALLTAFLVPGDRANTMSMGAALSVSALLAVYVVGMSVVGEGKTVDERETQHRYHANRAALIVGTVILSGGILYQLFTHRLDYWLLVGLIGINLTKIISLI